MRCGNPGEVPCRKALKQSPTPAAEPDQTGPGKDPAARHRGGLQAHRRRATDRRPDEHRRGKQATSPEAVASTGATGLPDDRLPPLSRAATRRPQDPPCAQFSETTRAGPPATRSAGS